MWVAVCFLAKISLHRPTCKTTFARLSQSQAISQSFRVFITFRSMRDTMSIAAEVRTSRLHHFQINERYDFFIFIFSSKLFFCTKLPFPLPWRICRWQVVNFKIHLCSSDMKSDCIWRSISNQYVQIEPGVNSDLGNGSFWVEIRDAKHVDLLTSRCTCRSTQAKIYTGLIASLN